MIYIKSLFNLIRDLRLNKLIFYHKITLGIIRLYILNI